MSFTVDLHVHTVASGHAYSTLMDYVYYAKKNGYFGFGLSDHGPLMPGAAHDFMLGNLKILPDFIEGIRVFKGVEANIKDNDGTIDVSDKLLKRLDYAIASLHTPVYAPQSKAINTQAVVAACKHPKVRILGHLGNPQYPLDYDAIVMACIENNVAIEINNSTFTSYSRHGSEDHCIYLAKQAYIKGANLILNSDAHFHERLGHFDKAKDILKCADVPLDYPVNSEHDKFMGWISPSLMEK